MIERDLRRLQAAQQKPGDSLPRVGRGAPALGQTARTPVTDADFQRSGNAVMKRSGPATLGLGNDWQGLPSLHQEHRAYGETVVDLGQVSGNVVIDLSLANVQEMTNDGQHAHQLRARRLADRRVPAFGQSAIRHRRARDAADQRAGGVPVLRRDRVGAADRRARPDADRLLRAGFRVPPLSRRGHREGTRLSDHPSQGADLMLGQMQRRVMGWKREQDETNPGTPTYPVGRRNAVRVVGAGYIFFRVDGSRRATFSVPATAGGSIPTESDRVAERTWFLFRDANNTAFYTADYLSAPANVRNPTSAEDPDGNFPRVYDQPIDSVLVEVRNGAIAAKTTTGTQTFLVGARATTPGPSDTYMRKSQTGVKALSAFVIGNQVTWAQAQAVGAVTDGIARYPATAINGTVGEFTLYAKYDPEGLNGPTRAGDTIVVNAPQRPIISAGGTVFVDLGRPATEAEASVNLERTF